MRHAQAASLGRPISPHLSPSLPISPHLSPSLPISPHLSPSLPISQAASLGRAHEKLVARNAHLLFPSTSKQQAVPMPEALLPVHRPSSRPPAVNRPSRCSRRCVRASTGQPRRRGAPVPTSRKHTTPRQRRTSTDRREGRDGDASQKATDYSFTTSPPFFRRRGGRGSRATRRSSTTPPPTSSQLHASTRRL